MNQKKYDWIPTVVTFLAGIAGALLLHFVGEDLRLGDETRPWWMGLFFLVIFLLGFAGLHIYLIFSKYQVQRPKAWYLWALGAAVLVFALGVGGEYVYMRSSEEVTKKETTEKEVASKENVDVVLLLDDSGSMEGYGYEPLRDDAAREFINGLDESTQLQVYGFAGPVDSPLASALLPMDDSGKTTARDYISTIDCYGITDFDFALEFALETLTTDPNVRPDSKKAVILLTDGEAYNLLGSCFQDYLDQGIQLFTIRIYEFDNLGDDTQRLIDLANSSGGHDEQLKPDADGKIDSSAILKAFQNAFASTSTAPTTKTSTSEKTVYTDDLLICSESVSFWKVILRTVALMIVAVLFGCGYFGRFSLIYALIGCGVGAILTVLAALIGSVLIASLISGALLATAVVLYEIPGGSYGGELSV